MVANHTFSVTGRMIKTARLEAEYYNHIDRPTQLVSEFMFARPKGVDLLSFVAQVASPESELDFHTEWDETAVLRLTTYETWWKKQINDKTRNMVRKAGKTGVEIRQVEFNDELAAGITHIYNECPIRQGRRFKHYGKDFATVKREHASFLDRCEFHGAFFNGEMIGFIKLVPGNGVANLMNIISMVSYRDKAPTNALLARAVERCTTLGIPFLHYGTWSRRSMGDFKKHHGFEKIRVARYFVPLSVWGKLTLAAGFHLDLQERLPDSWLDQIATWRGKFTSLRHRGKSVGAVAQLAERARKGKDGSSTLPCSTN